MVKKKGFAKFERHEKESSLHKKNFENIFLYLEVFYSENDISEDTDWNSIIERLLSAYL